MIDYLRALAARFRGLFGDRGADRELDDEIEMRLRLLTERYIRQGMTEAEAAWAARILFGNITSLKEANHEMHGIRLIETFIQDLRYSARTLRKTPGFAPIIVITLALGIGWRRTKCAGQTLLLLARRAVDGNRQHRPEWGL